MRNLVLILIVFIAIFTFIRVVENPKNGQMQIGSAPRAELNSNY